MCGGVITGTIVVNKSNSSLCVMGLLIAVVNRSNSSLCVVGLLLWLTVVCVWWGYSLLWLIGVTAVSVCVLIFGTVMPFVISRLVIFV